MVGLQDEMKMRAGQILIIIPAYNEADNIERVVDDLVMNYPQYDYVVINDGSSDDTRKICVQREYNLLDLPVNVGLSGAIKAGMRYANYYGYDYVVQIDGDGQHDPKYIAAMADTMKKMGCDIVIGSRFKTEKKPGGLRMLGSRLISGAIYITTGKKIQDVTSGMRLFDKRMIKRFGYDIHYSPEPDTLAYLLNCGFHIEEIQVKMRERMAGDSIYGSLLASARYMLQMMFSIFLFQWVRKRKE